MSCRSASHRVMMSLNEPSTYSYDDADVRDECVGKSSCSVELEVTYRAEANCRARGGTLFYSTYKYTLNTLKYTLKTRSGRASYVPKFLEVQT